jgi:hypothetical protein
MNLYSYLFPVNNGEERIFLSIINAESDPDAILGEKNIVGYLKNKDLPVTHENIVYNPVFIDHFHKTVKFFSQLSDAVILMAEQQQGGFVYIVDQRSKNDKHDPVDIIASFEVKHGALVTDSYEPNPKYQLISENGLFVLQKELEALLYTTATS